MKTYKIKPQDKIDRLYTLVIEQHITTHPSVSGRSILPRTTAKVLADHFKVGWDDTGEPVVKPKEPMLSLKSAGVAADTNECVEILLNTKYQDHLKPEQESPMSNEARNTTTELPKKAATERVAELKALRDSAMKRHDTVTMCTIKRVAASEGIHIL